MRYLLLFLLFCLSINAENIIAPADFKVTKIHEVDLKKQGSWISLCFDDKGQMYACDQYGSLYRIILNDSGVEEITEVKSPGKAHGLLWAFDSLYMMSNYRVKNTGYSILHRLRDENNDGTFEKVEDVLRLEGKGEHGPHAIVKTPDGKNLFVVIGNFTQAPDFPSRGTRNWREDTLLEHMPDAGGFSANKKAPGGLVLKISPDGKQKEIFASGLRNTYDIAVSPQGELFGYDSDADRDAGTPWYRPTRINHIVSGAEFGWRTGTSKWPDYYIDSLGAVIDIGPGCPTGMIFGTKTNWPVKYQKALFAMDWTYGRIYAVHLEEKGASYTAKQEIFIQGKPLAVTDMDVGPDGHMYFTTGGRRLQSALYKVEYVGAETARAEHAPANKLFGLRKSLEAFHQKGKRQDLKNNILFTAHADRNIRYAVRIAIEHQGYVFKEEYLIAEEVDTVLTLGIAAARCAPKSDKEELLNKLLQLNLNTLSIRQKIDLTRVYALIFSRMGEPAKYQSEKIAAQLSSPYPSNDANLDRELCRVLVYLDAPGVLEKTVKLMVTSKFEAQEFKTDFIPDYYTGGSAFKNLHKNAPNEQGIHFALMLTNQINQWTPDLAVETMKWLATQYNKIGGRCYTGYLGEIRRRIIANLDAESQKAAVKIPLFNPVIETANLPVPKGPGQAWTVSKALEVLKSKKGDPVNGERMYRAILCAKCHFKDGKGGEVGPDLNNLHTRFSARDTLDAIINPSAVISEQFVNMEVQLKSGVLYIGQLIDAGPDNYKVATNPFDLSQTVTVPKNSVLKIKQSEFSPMPPSLINALNGQELADIMAYLNQIN
ncbi:MAG: PQQ-dependent sugar dehydrogenase [Lentisphaerales bacterium]|nr:PQQ-dependent sugar dehydrogenase [Lentisphaerales bacterium]